MTAISELHFQMYMNENVYFLNQILFQVDFVRPDWH